MKLKLVLVVFCFASFFANSQTKVGTINSEFIVGLMPEAKEVLKELNLYASKLDSSYQDKLADYNAKVAAFQKLDPNLSDTFKKIKVDEIPENLIDEEVKKLIDDAKTKAIKILIDHKDELHIVAQGLLEYETLSGDEINDLIKGIKPSRDEFDDGNSSNSIPPKPSVPKTGSTTAPQPN